MSDRPLAADRIKAVLDRHGVSRALVEMRANEGHPGRRLQANFRVVQFSARIVAAMLELVSESKGNPQ